MPSTITHTYISLDTLEKVNKKPYEIISKNIEDYKTFAQGMDILYFYHIFLLKSNKVQSLGHRFHNYKTNDIFKYIIEYNKKSHSEIIFTYLAGLITHYVADSTIHPYVNFLAYNKNKLLHRDKHFEIETFLDNYMVNKKNNYYKDYKNYQLQFNNKKNNEIVTLINDIYKNFFNYPNMGKKYYKGLNEMRFVFKYFRYDKTGLKRKMYQLIDKNKLKVRRTTYLSYNFDLNNFDFYFFCFILLLRSREFYINNIIIKNATLYSTEGAHEWTAERTNDTFMYPSAAQDRVDYPCTRILEQNKYSELKLDLDMNRH